MGLGEKFKSFMGIEEYDDDEITEEEIEAEAKKIEAERKPEIAKPLESAKITAESVQSRATVSNTSTPFKMVVIEPKGFDECPKLVDSLKSRKPIVINLEKIEADTARKIFDFLSGATYALNGNVQKVANNIFIFAPENVNIAASVDHPGIDFSTQPKSIWER